MDIMAKNCMSQTERHTVIHTTAKHCIKTTTLTIINIYNKNNKTVNKNK